MNINAKKNQTADIYKTVKFKNITLNERDQAKHIYSLIPFVISPRKGKTKAKVREISFLWGEKRKWRMARKKYERTFWDAGYILYLD